MIRTNSTKLLAILAVMAMALVPAFALIDSDGSSAESQDISVNELDAFADLMLQARDDPDTIYNVTITDRVVSNMNITIPKNVNITIGQNAIFGATSEWTKGIGATLVNEGVIICNQPGSGLLGTAGENTTFINKGAIIMEGYCTLGCAYGKFMNYGDIYVQGIMTVFDDCYLYNMGTITVDGCTLCVNESDGKLVNKGTIECLNGGNLFSDNGAKIVNMGTIKGPVNGDLSNRTMKYDASLSEKLISDIEECNFVVTNWDFDNILSLLGGPSVADLVEESINSSLGDSGSVDVGYVETKLAVQSYFYEATYPEDMICRTAVFKADADLYFDADVTADLPVAGTYSLDAEPALQRGTVGVASESTFVVWLEIDAFFDKAEMLERVNISVAVGVDTVAELGMSLKVNENNYVISNDHTRYTVGAAVELNVGLDFVGIDIFGHEPGDKWTVDGTVRIADVSGRLGLFANEPAVELIKYSLIGDDSNTGGDILEQLEKDGSFSIDLTEAFQEMTGADIAKGSPIIRTAAGGNSAVADTSAGGSTLLDMTLGVAMEAEMDETGSVSLTPVSSSKGDLDLSGMAALVIDSRGGGGEFSVPGQFDANAWESIAAGAVASSGVITDEQASQIMGNLGMDYSESSKTLKDMNRLRASTLSTIDSMGKPEVKEDPTRVYIMAAVIAVLALAIMMPMLRKN